jgi:hypothetical protein
VKGAKNHAFQQFDPRDTLDVELAKLKPYNLEKLTEFADNIRAYVENIILRF